MSVFSHQERFAQTIETFKSIQKYAPESTIIISDTSVEALPDEWIQEILKYCKFFINLSEDNTLRNLSNQGLKSPAECLLFLNTLKTIKPLIADHTLDADRIFKLSGRYELNEGFNIDAYQGLNGKYVFKRRVQSWMGPNLSLLDVRLWSFDAQLLDKTEEMYSNALQHTSDRKSTRLNSSH